MGSPSAWSASGRRSTACTGSGEFAPDRWRDATAPELETAARAFETEAPEQRTKVVTRIAELAALVDEGRAAALTAVAEALRA